MRGGAKLWRDSSVGPLQQKSTSGMRSTLLRSGRRTFDQQPRKPGCMPNASAVSVQSRWAAQGL
jgi:hypothetical protein